MRPLLPLLLLPLIAACGVSPVTLNEFVASNVTGMTDLSGGTPDWIELYNTSAADVALDGWFISDNASNPQRHPLDGLTVPADGWLLLLASGDTSIGTNHLNFKLSATGEQVVLSDAEGIVDSTSYGEQTPDIGMARIPDGTGDWVAAEPSPGEANN
jgi:hypothetical protein